MPSPLGAGGFMFSGCTPVLPSNYQIRGFRAWNVACWLSWPPSELIKLWSWSVDFFSSNFGTILIEWNGSDLGSLAISWRTHRENGLRFCIMMYPDHLQNWLDYGHGLFIFLLLMSLWLNETVNFGVFRAFPGERIERWWREILHADVSWPPSDLIRLWSWLIFIIMALFWLGGRGQIRSFRTFPGESMEGMVRNFVCWCILTIFRTIALNLPVW